MNKVYVVIVNYKKYSDTIECLESVLKSNYADFQIFVVDNSPDDSSSSYFSDWVNTNSYSGITTNFNNLVFPLEDKPISHVFVNESECSNSDILFDERIVFIRSTNRGFAAANNIVLNYVLSRGVNSSLIWLLNNDTVVERNTLINLAAFYEQNPGGKFVCGGKLRFYHNPDVIQAIAGNYNKWIGKHIHIGSGEIDTGQYNNYATGKMDYIVGASMFFPKLFVEEAGLMCEDYFLYFEELDWMEMGIKKGFKPIVVPNAIIYHKEGSSIIGDENGKKDFTTAEYYSITNRVKFIKKWYPWNLITIMPGVIWALVKRIMQGKLSLVKQASGTIIKILLTDNFKHNCKIVNDKQL
jgi:GT2 family glycosyltransferase